MSQSIGCFEYIHFFHRSRDFELERAFVVTSKRRNAAAAAARRARKDSHPHSLARHARRSRRARRPSARVVRAS